MSRVKRGVTKHARHKKVIDAAKGYRGRRKNTFRIANQAVEKAGEYAYIGRKLKKRQFRALWIQRINAAARLHGMTYGRFMDGLNKPVSIWTVKFSPIWPVMSRRRLKLWLKPLRKTRPRRIRLNPNQR